jgi:DeoR family transcriptional regulator, suf operon transcriptional repressor
MLEPRYNATMQNVHPALEAMPETRRVMLNTLKRRGELGSEELATETGITPSGARQHLSSLERDGLIERREVREGVGRPRVAYRLTNAADALYPRTYHDLTNELLEYVGDDDPELLERIFQRRRERRLSNARGRLEGLDSLEARVRELTRILDEDGYVADVTPLEDGSGYRITEHNCAILGVAMKYGQACGSELEFIRAALPDTEIQRVHHIVSGAFSCTYEVRPVMAPSRKTAGARGSRRN